MNTNNKQKQDKNKYITVKRTKYMMLLSKNKNTNVNKNNNNQKNNQQKPKKMKKNKPRNTTMRKRNGIMGDPYAVCRLTPFKSKGIGNGIPDGSDARKILIDHRMTNTFTFGSSGTFDILITPSIPSAVWFRANPGDTTFTVNGATYGFNTGDRAYGTAICLPEWRGLKVNLGNQIGYFDDAAALYGANKCRIVTVGWSLSYIGTDYQNSGVMLIQTFGLGAGDLQPNMDTFTVKNSQADSQKVWNQGQIQMRMLGSDPFQDLSTRSLETKTIPLRKGANGVLKHSANDYEWCEVSPNLVFLTSPETEKQSCLKLVENGTPESVVGHWPHVAAYDNDWGATVIKITGGSQGASFMLDTIHCVEYIPAMNSESYSLAKGSSADKPGLIKEVSDTAKKMPVSFVGAAAEGLKTAASLGLEFGSLLL